MPYPPGTSCGSIAVIELSRKLPRGLKSMSPTPTPPTPTAPAEETGYRCPNCDSFNFLPSPMKNRCFFCDGTEGGQPPTKEEVDEWNWRHSCDDPCDEIKP